MKTRTESLDTHKSHQLNLTDTHCHLDMDAYDSDLEAVLSTARDHGVNQIITIGINTESSKRGIAIAQSHRGVYATVGIHPHDAASATSETLEQLSVLTDSEKVVGFGEIGLDYVKKYAPVETQKQAFAMQLGLAREVNLPLVIHDREAHEDTLRQLKLSGPFPAGGVMHCFSGDVEFARQIIDLGFHISIPGIVTFKNATELHRVAQQIDLRHILIETDGPFLAPIPFRGKRNTPDKVRFTAQKIAELKEVSIQEVADQTTANATTLFKLPELK